MTTNTFKNLLDKVKEKGIVDIILSNKKDMESKYCVKCDKQCKEYEGSTCNSCPTSKWFCWEHLATHEMECEYD